MPATTSAVANGAAAPTAPADARAGEILRVGPLEITPEEHAARAGGRTLTLSIRELRLLTELARRIDRIVSREELFMLVWGRAMRKGDRSVDVYVRKLRVKLAQALPSWDFIHTHFGLGYRLYPEQLGALSELLGRAAPPEEGPKAETAPRNRDFTTG